MNSSSSKIGKPQRSKLRELPGQPMRQQADGDAPAVERWQRQQVEDHQHELTVMPILLISRERQR